MKRGLRTHHNPRMSFIVSPEGDEGGGAGDEAPLEGADASDNNEDGDGDEAGFDPARALAKIKKLNSENQNLRAAKKAAEDKAAGADEKDQRITALEVENRRIRVGASLGLPGELIDRLKGDTDEEILADAEKLLALVGGNKPPTRKPNANLRGGGDPAEAPDEDPRKIVESIPRGL